MPLSASDDQLARAVRQKLLDTDLAQVVPPMYCRLTPALIKSTSGKVGETGRGAVLLQIESMIDIGHSCSTQLDIAEARRDVKATLNGDKLLETAQHNVALRESGTTPASHADHMNDIQAQEEDKMHSATVFPHRMLKLELSDGSNNGLGRVSAIEQERIAALDMNTLKIGAKMLLKGAPIRSGYVLLSPKEVTVEGGQVHDKAIAAETNFINTLRAKLGKPPASNPTANPAGEDSARANVADKVTRKRAVEVDDLDDDGTDDTMLLAALDAQERSRAKPPSQTSDPPLSLPTFKRQLVVPQTLLEKSKPKNVADTDAISLLDSDDDELFSTLDEDALLKTSLPSTREDPIVIESSPEL